MARIDRLWPPAPIRRTGFFRRRRNSPRDACTTAMVLLTAAATLACSSSESRRQEGARLFREQGCLVCHGPEGHGNGERAAALIPPPRDFRDLDAYLQGTDAVAISETIKTGIRIRGAQMPSFAHLSQAERRALGEFIVWLRKQP